MRLIIILSLLCIGHNSFSSEPKKGLPEHYDMTELQLQSIPHSKELFINALITIPNSHKVSGRPFTIHVYEKLDNQWIKTSSLKSISFLTKNNQIKISGKVKLQSSDSDVALDSTIYHCGKYCVINNFQGIAKRSHQSSAQTLSVKMDGYLPTDKMKSL